MQSESVPCLQSDDPHRLALVTLKKSVEFWFLGRRDSAYEQLNNEENILQIQLAVKAILLNGLQLEEGECVYKKLINDLHWLNSSSLLSQRFDDFTFKGNNTGENELSRWISWSLANRVLCSSLQHLVADKELLETYYGCDAFLCDEKYATALFICISAVELNQSSLISQIDSSLYELAKPLRSKHKRSSSHPHFSISPKKSECKFYNNTDTNHKANMIKSLDGTDMGSKCLSGSSSTHEISVLHKQKSINQLKYRRWKSLPNIRENFTYIRQRSQTISQPISIPGRYKDLRRKSSHVSYTVPNFDYRQYNESISSDYNNTASTSKTPDFSDLVPIQLVKCDDIKIHLDQSQNRSAFQYPNSLNERTIDYDSPPHSKGVSPINFLSCISTNLFSPQQDEYARNHSALYSTFSTSVPSDFVSAFLPQEGEKLRTRNVNNIFDDFIEPGLDTNETSVRIPLSGQSLASFLQSANFSRNNTDLERENAHFKISEAIISVIEHIKWTKSERELERKAEMQKSKEEARDESSNKASSSNSITDTEDFKTSAESVTDTTIPVQKTKRSASIQSIYGTAAYAEWGENNLDALSAEGVALSLISKFSDKQLPKASDIVWLVSEEEAPQKLLPMPGSPSADPDDNFVHSFTRGTRDWAPPRQQIIFTDHSPPNRTKQMQKQNNRCAGCGMRVSFVYINRFRYCTYFGKYHCTGCHRNQISTIPAKVLEKWDFTYYPVSVFAYRLLEQISTYPLFYVPDLNPNLYTKIKSLHMAKVRRIQLKFVQDFIKNCRFAEDEKKLFDEVPSYWSLDPNKWAMSDFVAAKNGSLQKNLLNLIVKCEEHVFNCVLCTARGFLCELCSSDRVIYPWQSKVKRCDDCGTCFHQKCWRNVPECTKCVRLRHWYRFN